MAIEIKKRPARKRVFRVVSSDDTPLQEEVINLREIVEGVYCDDGRECLYTKVMVEATNEGGESEKQARYRKLPLQTSGMPRLLTCYTVDGRSSKKLDEETFYKVEWSKRSDCEPGTYTEREINTGEFTAATPGITATSRRERDFLAKVVKSQVRAFDIPVGRAKRTTGWHKDNKTGQWSYYFRDGRYYGGQGWQDPNIPIAGYDFKTKRRQHHNAWLERSHVFSRKATPADGVELLTWQRKSDQTGKLVLLTAFTYRSLIATFLPVGTATMSIAKDGTTLMDGSSMSGKTTEIDFARGIDGPCPYKTLSECAFTGSLTGIETRIAPIHDLPISVSDFHMLAGTEREINDIATKIDKLIRSSADGGEISERGTRTIEAREGTIIGGGLMIDGEKMPPLLLSRLRRAMVLQYERGEINTELIHAGWDRNQAIHTAIGQSIIAYVNECVNQDEQAFTRRLREQEERFEQSLFTRYQEEHKGSSEQVARALSQCYARTVTGSYLADCAISGGITGLVDTTLQIAYTLMCKQIQFIIDGGATCVDRDWIIRTIRTLLDDHVGHALDMQEQELDPATYGRLGRYGYERYGDDGWIPRGVYLCNVTDDQSAYYFKNEQLDEKLRRQAEREHIKWTYTPQTLPKALIKWDIVTPEYDENKQFKRSAHLLRIGPTGETKPQRRLYISASIFEMLQEDEETLPPQPPATTPPPAEIEQEIDAAGERIDASIPAEVTGGQTVEKVPQVLLEEMAISGATLRVNAGNQQFVIGPDALPDELYQRFDLLIQSLTDEQYQWLYNHIAATPLVAASPTPPPAASRPQVNELCEICRFNRAVVIWKDHKQYCQSCIDREKEQTQKKTVSPSRFFKSLVPTIEKGIIL